MNRTTASFTRGFRLIATVTLVAMLMVSSGFSMDKPNTIGADQIQSKSAPDSGTILNKHNSHEILDLERVEVAFQYGPAAVCYTFAGPTCPMRVPVPEGAPCTCYLPGLPPLAGQAW